MKRMKKKIGTIFLRSMENSAANEIKLKMHRLWTAQENANIECCYVSILYEHDM